MCFIVIGGFVFIGSAIVQHIINDVANAECIVDKPMYA